jgi:hypothetical protein
VQDQVIATSAPDKRVPWNKGKLTGAKPPLRPKHVWSIRTKLQTAALATLPCSIWRSTASYVDTTSLPSGSRMSQRVDTQRNVQRSDKRQLDGPSGSS